MCHRSLRQAYRLRTEAVAGIVGVYLAAVCHHAPAALLVPGNYLVMDQSRLFQVDRFTGDREHVSPFGFISGAGVAVDRFGKIFVVDSFTKRVYRVEAQTGDATIISGPDDGGNLIGAGPAFGYPIGLIFDPGGNLIIADRDAQAVFTVDPVTGDRTILSGGSDNIGQGSDFFAPHDVYLAESGEIIAGGGGMNALVAIDPVTGDRRAVSRAADVDPIGNGPVFRTITRIVEMGPDKVFVSAALLPPGNVILSIDLTTGDRSLVLDQFQLFGLPPQDLIMKDTDDLLVLTHGPFRGILRHNFASNETTWFSHGDVRRGSLAGSGPDFFSPSFIVEIPMLVPEPSGLVMALLGSLLIFLASSRSRKFVRRDFYQCKR